MPPVCTNCGSGEFVWTDDIYTGTLAGGSISLRPRGQLSLGARVCRSCGMANFFLIDVSILRNPQAWAPGEFTVIRSRADPPTPKPAQPSPSPHPTPPPAVTQPPPSRVSTREVQEPPGHPPTSVPNPVPLIAPDQATAPPPSPARPEEPDSNLSPFSEAWDEEEPAPSPIPPAGETALAIQPPQSSRPAPTPPSQRAQPAPGSAAAASPSANAIPSQPSSETGPRAKKKSRR